MEESMEVDISSTSGQEGPSTFYRCILGPSQSLKPETYFIMDGLPTLTIPVNANGFVDVVVSYVESVEMFYVQLQNETSVIQNLSDRLNHVYQSSDRNPSFNPWNGDLCIAKYSGDARWYRAVVLDQPKPGFVEVYFIDYGNTDRLPASELRIAKEEFIYIPPQAFQCRLKKVSPNLANDEKFRQIAEGRKMIIQLEDVVGTAFEVLMFDESAQGNVNEMLIDYSKNQQVATTAVQPPPSIFIPVTNLKDIPSVQLLGAPEMFPVSSGLQHRVKEEVNDIAKVVSSCMKAIQHLRINAENHDAQRTLTFAEEYMKDWSENASVSCEFRETTDAVFLTAEQLAPAKKNHQAWTRKDQLKSGRPLQSGIGMSMLQNMGWTPGEGLGRQQNGALTPILPEIKLNRKGVGLEDKVSTKRNVAARKPINITGKNAICILYELCSKCYWDSPVFNYEVRRGQHLCSVVVNGYEFRSEASYGSKKLAKLKVAELAVSYFI